MPQIPFVFEFECKRSNGNLGTVCHRIAIWQISANLHIALFVIELPFSRIEFSHNTTLTTLTSNSNASTRKPVGFMQSCCLLSSAHCPHIVQMTCRCHLHDMRMTCRCHPYDVQMMCRQHMSSSSEISPEVSLSCHPHVIHTSSACHLHVVHTRFQPQKYFQLNSRALSAKNIQRRKKKSFSPKILIKIYIRLFGGKMISFVYNA